MKKRLGPALAVLSVMGLSILTLLVILGMFGSGSPSKPRWGGNVVAAADAAKMRDDELIVGTLTRGEARAYAIGDLLDSEHVNDKIAAHPVLATW